MVVYSFTPRILLAALSAPLLIVLYGLWLLLQPRNGGFSDLAGAIMIMVAFFCAVIVSIGLFLLRKRKLSLWQALLLSCASVPLGFVLLLALTYFGDVLAGYR